MRKIEVVVVQPMNSTALLSNRYQIIKTLGRGGFGETFLAIDTHLPSGKKCVIKQLKPIVATPEIPQWMCDRFEQEAHILESLGQNHSQIPQLYAYFQENNNFFLVQEWIDGITLTSKVEEEGVLSSEEVEYILIKLLPVLDYIHRQNIVHRDLKPDNIIYRHIDKMPVLIDFGAVKEAMTSVMHNGSSAYSIAIGTPGYMSSEQAAGRPIYSSDLYSLGLTAIYLLTGKTPQYLQIDSRSGEILWRDEIPHLHSNLAGVIDRAIRFNPRERFPTAQEMLDALQLQRHNLASQAATVALGGRYSDVKPPSSLSEVKTRVASIPTPPPKTVTPVTPPPRQTSSRQSSSFFNPLPFLLFLSLGAIASFFIGYSLFPAPEIKEVQNNTDVVETEPKPPIVEDKITRIRTRIEENIPNINNNNPSGVQGNDSVEISPQNEIVPEEVTPEDGETETIPPEKIVIETPPESPPESLSITTSPPPKVETPIPVPSSLPVVIKAPSLPVASLGISTAELAQKFGQPSSKNLAKGDTVTIATYDNPTPGIAQINYIIDNKDNNLTQIELSLSPQTGLEVITATVNQAVNGGVTAGVQEAIRAVIDGETDLRSFNVGKYQGMIQKRDNLIEVRMWDANFVF